MGLRSWTPSQVIKTWGWREFTVRFDRRNLLHLKCSTNCQKKHKSGLFHCLTLKILQLFNLFWPTKSVQCVSCARKKSDNPIGFLSNSVNFSNAKRYSLEIIMEPWNAINLKYVITDYQIQCISTIQITSANHIVYSHRNNTDEIRSIKRVNFAFRNNLVCISQLKVGRQIAYEQNKAKVHRHQIWRNPSLIRCLCLYWLTNGIALDSSVSRVQANMYHTELNPRYPSPSTIHL